jgi:hypothetical protein
VSDAVDRFPSATNVTAHRMMRPEHFVCQHVNSIVRRVIGHIELFLNHAPLFIYLGFVNQRVANHVDENVESLVKVRIRDLAPEIGGLAIRATIE